jgi:NAD(P)-dependent dehydrogenase (short-subunit alcohol dehydrogenase family)
MPWSERDVPDQTGRVAIVTGANGGLGYENARALAASNATVIMAVRNQDKAATAKRDIEKAHPDAKLDVRELDLASLESIHAFADGAIDDYDRLDILLNNAGVMAIP